MSDEELGSDSVAVAAEENSIFVTVRNSTARPKEWCFPLKMGQELEVGRGIGNDIVISSPYISRKHLLLRWREEGVVVEDLKSRNGTILNNALIQGPHPLKTGDCIQLGDTTLTACRDSEVDLSKLLVVQPKLETKNAEISGNAELQSMLARENSSPDGLFGGRRRKETLAFRFRSSEEPAPLFQAIRLSAVIGIVLALLVIALFFLHAFFRS